MSAIHADVEVVLDLRDCTDPPTTKDDFRALWAAVEPALFRQDLRRRRFHEFEGGAGRIVLEVVRVADHVREAGPATRFGVVGVRESARIRYKCRQCAADDVVRYGPFICRTCDPGAGNGPADNRVCDRHVSILDGALTATCGEHRPDCAGCRRRANFRCNGPRCRRDGVAWCDDHRRPHPGNTDLDYCPTCSDILFPPCAASGCADLGSIRCEHVEATGRACGRRMCSRHGSRWQVFGGERLGLGRCPAHVQVRGLPASEVLRQIVAGAGRRRSERLPSLRGFAFNLRVCMHRALAVDYDRIVTELAAASDRMTTDRDVADALAKAWPRWRQEHHDIRVANAHGEELVALLRTMVLQHDPRYGPEIAASVQLAEYNPAVARADRSRRALLYVRLPEHLRGRLKGKGRSLIQLYGARLDAEIRFEDSEAGT